MELGGPRLFLRAVPGMRRRACPGSWGRALTSPVMSPRIRLFVMTAARCGLAALFIVAGALKWRDPSGFAQEIANYRLWPELAPHLAALLPAVEITAGLALLIAPVPWRRAAAAALVLLTAAFTLAVATAVVRGLDIDCGCFGAASSRVSWLTVGRNLILLVAASWLVAVWRPQAVNASG